MDFTPQTGPVFLAGCRTVRITCKPSCGFGLPLGTRILPIPVFSWRQRRRTPVPTTRNGGIARTKAFAKIEELGLVDENVLSLVPRLVGPDMIPPANGEIIHQVVVM